MQQARGMAAMIDRRWRILGVLFLARTQGLRMKFHSPAAP